MLKFSKSWKSSVKPRKQRNYIARAPKHTKSKMMVSHLSDDLSKKHKRRSLRVVVGDKVTVMTGQFKTKTGKVEKVDLSKGKVYIAGVELQKKDGTKVKYPITSSNLMITELKEDKKRLESIKRE
ncbi:MAG: 50S ribosomal protein L24 [Nanoarchaeota archaeon]|nr:50S ribosomal protein L24 [Nanoarchaeota archaeon]